MDKSPVYAQQIQRSYDFLSFQKSVDAAIGRVVTMLLGVTYTCVRGFGAVQQSLPNLTFILGQGEIYNNGPADETPFGTLPADSTTILRQGHADQQVISLDTSALSAGQEQYALIQITFQHRDIVPSSDPTGGLLAFFNSIAPNAPLQGPGGSGSTLPTLRQGYAAVIPVIYGAPAATGTAVPPQPSGGSAGLYLIKLAFGQTQILTGDIKIAGPNIYSGYPDAPFINGYLAKHHTGAFGNAPKIDLSAEVQNIIGFANIPGTNDAPAVTGGVVLQGGKLAVITYINVTPNGNFAGKKGDIVCFATDTPSPSFWNCITTGTSSTAAWIAIASIIPLHYTPIQKAGNFTANDASGTIYDVDTTSPRTITMKPNPGDGTVYKIAGRVGGNADITINASIIGGGAGTDAIIENGNSDSFAVLHGPYTGVIELVALAGGWNVT